MLVASPVSQGGPGVAARLLRYCYVALCQGPEAGGRGWLSTT